MRSVVICGSRRFKPEIRKFADDLKKSGVVVYEPFLTSFGWDKWKKEHPKIPVVLATGLTLHHIDFIKQADVCYIYNKDGYAGNSTTLEIGAAAALCKTIYVLEEDEELCRQVLYKDIVKTPHELIQLLK